MRKALKLYIFVIVVVAVTCKASVAKYERRDVKAEDFFIRDSLADVRYAKTKDNLDCPWQKPFRM